MAKPEPARKKELLAQYRQHKPAAGVLAVCAPDGSRYYLRASSNIHALARRERFQLELGSHPCRELQSAWTAAKGAGFDIRVLRELEQEDNDPADMKEELDILTLLVEQELQAEGKQPY